MLAGAAILVAVVAFLALGGGSRIRGGTVDEDLEGKWTSQKDPQSWIEFLENGGYQEGYGKEKFFKNAEYEVRSRSQLLIRKGQVTVLYPYQLSGDDLTLEMNAGPEKYVR